jgi:two-component system, NtrC family, sensor histidine kinase HydH
VGNTVKHFRFGWYAWPFVALGGLVAVAGLAGTGYINQLQADLARAIRYDAAGRDAAVELQVQLRHLRVHSLVLVADPSDDRREVVHADLARVNAALATLRHTVVNPDDARLVSVIERDYAAYRDRLALDHLPAATGSMADVARWSDDHHMADLLVPCRELADRQRDRMNDGLARTETQTAWAGRVLLGLGLAGVLSGVLSGYATARGLSLRAARLFVRVQAVQAHLDQEVGAMTVERPGHLGGLDEQLDRVVGRVKEVCERLQEQERDLLRAEQLAAVGQLAAGVAHEVRNPLTGVKLLLQAAARPEAPTPLTPDRLTLLLQEVARIERTVQGLMDFARTPPPDRRPYDLRGLAAEAVEVSQGRAEAKSVALRVDAPADSIPAVVDRDQMLALLANLLSNAIDATPPGGEVGVCVRAGSAGTLTVEVTDTGQGIDPAVAGRLFTPFATTKPTGTGLGLTVARRVAKDHGGTLTAANRPEGGASFTLTLPAPEESYVQAADR